MYGLPEHSASSVPQYVTNLTNTLKEAFADARKNITTHQERQAEVYNKRIHGRPYVFGDLVWLFNPVVPRGSFKKFHKPWTGPYKVIEKLSDSTYCIKNTQRPFKIKVVYFDRLKLCNPGTRLPQVDSQLPATDQHQSPPSPPLIGTNIEIIDELEIPQAPQHRYPRRDHHVTPSWYADFVRH